MDWGLVLTFIIAFLSTNFIYGLFFLIAYKGISNFYPWITQEMDGVIFLFASIVLFPVLGVTYHVAAFAYGKCNWFFARLVILFYLAVLITLIVLLSNVLMKMI
ncbi:hypothetical protein [Aneurinibacillus tyrosinisolvens]|uniref:hypothetical protein n=1 Tax=Aneurinibacillus tyrosinisolvens TaxID=1443435 RepID=UPI00063F4AB3|nr:hypothetical protein [Aneurinibacillus tyrosinisolvens]